MQHNVEYFHYITKHIVIKSQMFCKAIFHSNARVRIIRWIEFVSQRGMI